MRSRTLFAAVSFVVLSACAVSVIAHHSIAAEYDFSKTITLNGTISKVEWTNPHVWIQIDAKDPADGKTVQWHIETNSPSCMEGQGIGKESLAVGSTVTVRNAPVAKDGSRVAYVNSISDGTKTVDATLEVKSIVAPRPAAEPKPSPEPVETNRRPAVQPKPGSKDIELQPLSGTDPLALQPLSGTDPLTLITTLPGYRAQPMGHCYNTILGVAQQPQRDR